MPEIPEIETVRSHLIRRVLGKTIREVIINRERSLNVAKEQFVSAVAGRQITGIQRRAKQIILQLAGERSLVVHFMLEGYMRFFYEHEEMEKTPSVLLVFDGNQRLGLFKLNLGYVHLAHTIDMEQIEELKDLGPEPLEDAFTPELFMRLLEGRKGMIKPLLMEQQFIAGIGNVYSNETLFCAGILPERKISGISVDERYKLYYCIRDVLRVAVQAGGVYDETFASDDNITGGFEKQLKVAYRTGKPCFTCGTSIETKRVGGRNAFFCPVCQT